MRIVAIVQARMGSTRLPGKVMLLLAGKPVIQRVIERLQRAEILSEIVIATTTTDKDDVIVELCSSLGVKCYRGSEDDVLDRYYWAAKTAEADVVVRITSDCPLIDPTIVDQIVRGFLERMDRVDYANNGYPKKTFPRGLDVEVFSFSALKRAWNEDDSPRFREHVTPYLYMHPDKFKIWCMEGERDLSRHRWTLDTPEDYKLISFIFDYFGDSAFLLEDVLVLLEHHPEWSLINADVQQKEV